MKNKHLVITIGLACNGLFSYSQTPTTTMNEVEPNNTINYANIIPPFEGETVAAGSILDPSDSDYYKIEVPSGKRLSILFGAFNTVKRRVFYLWQWGIAYDMKVRYENPYWNRDNSKTKFPATWKNEQRFYEEQCGDYKITTGEDGKNRFQPETNFCGIFAEGPTPTPNGDGAVEITIINNFDITILDNNLNNAGAGFDNASGGSIGVAAFGSMRDKKFVYTNISASSTYFYVKISKGDPRYLAQNYDFNIHIE